MSERIERLRAARYQAALNELIAQVFINANDKTLTDRQRVTFIKHAAGRAQLRYRELVDGDD